MHISHNHNLVVALHKLEIFFGWSGEFVRTLTYCARISLILCAQKRAPRIKSTGKQWDYKKYTYILKQECKPQHPTCNEHSKNQLHVQITIQKLSRLVHDSSYEDQIIFMKEKKIGCEPVKKCTHCKKNLHCNFYSLWLSTISIFA